MSEALKDAHSHFAFGENWASYAATVTDKELNSASGGLTRLLGDQIRGKRFLDIGCGSGVHSAAALKLGAREVVAIDLDLKSVETTRSMLSRFAENASFRTQCISVFDLAPDLFGGPFGIVYSWGVLHHTGDVRLAIARAANMVAPGGLLALALYRKTWLCPLWKLEKRWYSRASARSQRFARRAYVKWFRLIAGRFSDVDDYLASYSGARGMSFEHDVHDWLGGYPYESMLPPEVRRLLHTLGFELEKMLPCVAREGRTHGLLGSGCDEYVFRRAG